jgi:hypothetical protein
MKVTYFVKDGCDACKKARHKVGFYLDRWGLADEIEAESFNVSNVDGLAESAWREIADIPCVILEEDGAEVARWTKNPPTSAELMTVLGLGEGRPDAPAPELAETTA